jgi:Tol biopolymer transport system component
LITSSQADFNPSYSPDGQRIAFVSLRTGTANIWICDSDGANPVQLTEFEHWASTPRWSPDSQWIVFDSVRAENWDLYLIGAEGGPSRRLTRGPSADNVGTWSRDGRWIYFASDRTGRSEVWRISVDGGEAAQVTRGGGHYAEESWDRQHVYYAKRDYGRPGIWRVPVDGGEEIEVVPSGTRSWTDWALSRSGIYFATLVPRARGEEYTIRFLDFSSGQATELFRKEGPYAHGWLAVSPDEEWILYREQSAPESELMLVENFR